MNSDQFSGYTTACFTDTKNREDLNEALIKVVTPIRHNAKVAIRMDKAGAFVSFVETRSETLERFGFSLELGDDFYKNSNYSVDRKIR